MLHVLIFVICLYLMDTCTLFTPMKYVGIYSFVRTWIGQTDWSKTLIITLMRDFQTQMKKKNPRRVLN